MPKGNIWESFYILESDIWHKAHVIRGKLPRGKSVLSYPVSVRNVQSPDGLQLARSVEDVVENVLLFPGLSDHASRRLRPQEADLQEAAGSLWELQQRRDCGGGQDQQWEGRGGPAPWGDYEV